jgi:hypothetical protein
MKRNRKCRFLGPKVNPQDTCPDCLKVCVHVPSHGQVRHSGYCQTCPDYRARTVLQPREGVVALPQIDDLPNFEGTVVSDQNELEVELGREGGEQVADAVPVVPPVGDELEGLVQDEQPAPRRSRDKKARKPKGKGRDVHGPASGAE